MLLTSFYTYKKPPKPSNAMAGPSGVSTVESQSEAVKLLSVKPILEEPADVSKGEEKKEKEKEEVDDVGKPVNPDEGGPDKPVSEPDKPAGEAEKPVEEAAGEGETPIEKPSDEGGKLVSEPDKPAEKPEKPVEGSKGEEKEGEAVVPSGEAVVPTSEAPPPPTPPAVAPPPRVPPRNQKPRTDVTDLAILVRKILSVSEKVARVVSELKRQEGSYSRQASVSTPIADSAPASFDFYMKAMKPLQFGKSEHEYEQPCANNYVDWPRYFLALFCYMYILSLYVCVVHIAGRGGSGKVDFI